MRPVWHVLTSYFDAVLEKLTLGDLARSESESRVRIEEFARQEAERVSKRFGILPEPVLANLRSKD